MFDSATRNLLSGFVARSRRLLCGDYDKPGGEITSLLQTYGIQPDGTVAKLDALPGLDQRGHELASTLRELLAYKQANSPAVRAWGKYDPHVYDLIQEQGFTVLNRLCALRMAEERGILPCPVVSKGPASDGFDLYEMVADKKRLSREERYEAFLFSIFDELSLDLSVLFDRFSIESLLFPRPEALAALLDEINAPALAPLWAEDETIGWIYQYWNSKEERKAMRDASAAPRNSRELAVRNQFFTPRYVVEFLTDNTLGRIWYEMTKGRTRLKDQCRYLVRRPTEIFLNEGESPPADNEEPGTKNQELSQEELLRQPVLVPHRLIKDPREIRLLDPACGSMHFGLYAFDLFEAIYEEAWDLADTHPELRSLTADFSSKEAFLREVPRLIIEHNIHGIDIDPRAVQIAGLSLWLRAQKAWEKQRLPTVDRPRVRRSNIVCAEPMPGSPEMLEAFVKTLDPPLLGELVRTVFEKMQLAGEAGSLLKIEEEILTAIEAAKKAWEKLGASHRDLFSVEELNQTLRPGAQPELTGFEKALASDLRPLTSDFWESAEQQVIDALRAYAEQADTDSYQRRLFADDAARGFAFIDLCRKRYDAVVMNPPFGEFVSALREWSKVQFETSYQNILAAFVARGLAKLQDERGFLGAITSRTCFFLAGLSNWREQVLLGESEFYLFADLGHGVMDAAHVEAAAYILRGEKNKKAIPRNYAPLFMELLGTENKAESLLPTSGLEEWKSIQIAELQKVPGTPFSYWLSPGQRDLFVRNEPFDSGDRVCKQGLATANDNRYLRIWWEVPVSSIHKSWRFYVKGGARAPFHNDVVMVANWGGSGAEIKNDLNTRGVPRSNVWMLAQTEQNYFFRPAITWSRRAKQFSPNILPAGCIFSVRSECAFMSKDHLYAALGLMNAPVFDYLFKALLGESGRPEFIIGTLKKLPWPDFSIETKSKLKELAISAANGLRESSSIDQTTLEFVTVFRCFAAGSTLEESLERLKLDSSQVESLIVEVRDQLGQVAFDAFNLSGSDRVLVGGSADSNTDEEVEGESDEEEEVALDFGEFGKGVPDYLLGTAFGRWDIRYATGERQPPELPDPFDPLPVCPPGMLQGDDGLPLAEAEFNRRYAVGGGQRAEEAAKRDGKSLYPLPISWSGILVDDETHPEDIVARVRDALAVIWKDRAGAIEQEACEILGVKTLRDYFRRPAGFFADHLKRYSKSRRQAPIYWPLSTESGSYTLWIYYHRLSSDTLYACLTHFVIPKQEQTERTLARLGAKSGRSTAEDKEYDAAAALVGELATFRAELERLAKIWKPDLNDGVQITAAPLWNLFRLPKWQKTLKETWQQLEKGNYDWAHLALSLRPEHVIPKCAKDRSLAIAHGYDEALWHEVTEKKGKRTTTTWKPKPDAAETVARLVAERTGKG